jgi:biopolymer transport protein ExbD
MQIRAAKSSENKVEQQMTPMIDVVFQLLVFFVMSFKVASLEGDFHIQMPLPGRNEGVVRPDVPPLKLRLTSDERGELASLSLNQQVFAPSDWSGVQRRLLDLVGSASGPGSVRESLEVEIDCDYQLRYDHAIAAVTAISGTRSPSGELVPLVERVKFSPPRTTKDRR